MSGSGDGYFERLVRELARLPAETQWVEFKENKDEPEMIGKAISALSNSATLNGQEKAYLVWGVRDGTHEIVGTTFTPGTAKKGPRTWKPGWSGFWSRASTSASTA